MAILPSCLLSSAALPTRLLPSVIEIQESCFALVYNAYGLRLDQFHVDNLTLVSCWVPASRGGKPAASPAVSSAAIPAKPPLLLLHGFGASSLNHWINQLAAFSRHFDLYIPDLLFFRGSYSRDSRRDERFQAEAMIALMDRLGIQRCAVVGVSYGGIIAHKMATLFPERVTQLVLGGAGLMLTRDEVQGVLQHWHAKTPPDLFLPTDPSGLLRLIRLGNNEAPYLPDWLLQDALEVLFENREEKAGLLEASLREAQANAQHPEGISVPSMPTLLVWGGSDQLFPHCHRPSHAPLLPCPRSSPLLPPSLPTFPLPTFPLSTFTHPPIARTHVSLLPLPPIWHFGSSCRFSRLPIFPLFTCAPSHCSYAYFCLTPSSLLPLPPSRHFGSSCWLEVIEKGAHAIQAHKAAAFNSSVLSFLTHHQ
ncbi:unnamed protein product [Closterium sp. Yama58-4]|nr:unnamed protein product [Closterium sp. Yama58-4]